MIFEGNYYSYYIKEFIVEEKDEDESKDNNYYQYDESGVIDYDEQIQNMYMKYFNKTSQQEVHYEYDNYTSDNSFGYISLSGNSISKITNQLCPRLLMPLSKESNDDINNSNDIICKEKEVNVRQISVDFKEDTFISSVDNININTDISHFDIYSINHSFMYLLNLTSFDIIFKDKETNKVFKIENYTLIGNNYNTMRLYIQKNQLPVSIFDIAILTKVMDKEYYFEMTSINIP